MEKLRKDMNPAFCWNLADIFENNAAWQAALDAVSEKVAKIPAVAGTLGASKEALKAGLDQLFATAGNMPKRICDFCRKTGQHVPENVGEIVRCIFESLALRYRWTAEKLEELTGRHYPTINIVGGGTKEEMLSRFTADASHKTVCAGPVEATTLGNIAMQCIASGEIEDIWAARRIIRESFDIIEYKPSEETASAWDEAYARFLKIIGE